MHVKKRDILISSLIALVIILLWIPGEFEMFLRQTGGFFERYATEHRIASMIIFTALAALSTMLVSFSSIWLVPIASAAFGHAATTSMLLAGWLLGGILAYFIGRSMGSLLTAHVFNVEKVRQYHDTLFEGKTGLGLMLLMRFTLPSEIPSYLLGIARYHFGTYCLTTFLAELPYAVASVYAIDAVIAKDGPVLLLWASVWLILILIGAGISYAKIRGKYPGTAKENTYQ